MAAELITNGDSSVIRATDADGFSMDYPIDKVENGDFHIKVPVLAASTASNVPMRVRAEGFASTTPATLTKGAELILADAIEDGSVENWT